ncbi:hypothetical protein BGP75_23260 [Motiliproteus sp. MSK22-1]|nr:hypothetical protein BGP75_23260 [Motiliproteus sp. MSK22-1]
MGLPYIKKYSLASIEPYLKLFGAWEYHLINGSFSNFQPEIHNRLKAVSGNQNTATKVRLINLSSIRILVQQFNQHQKSKKHNCQ